ncbi:Tyrosine recombinase XerD [subsurface metagenome]
MKILSPASQALYAYWQGRFQDWLDGRPATIEAGEAFLTSLQADGLKPNTWACAGRALRRLGLPVQVPAVEMGEPRYLELEEVKRLIDKAPSLLERTILIVTFGSACRISEILNLELPDLELDAGVATVTRKGGRRERIALGKQGTEALTEWLAKRRFRSRRVFMDYTYNDIYRLLKRLGREAGIPDFTPHRLRHSRAIQLLEAKVPERIVSQILGHTKTDTTLKIYGRLHPEKLTEHLQPF